MAAHPDDIARIRRWFERLAHHVGEVDFAGARPLFADDLVAFGTVAEFVTGRAAVEQAQWRNVWPHIDGFCWRPDIRAIVAADRLSATGMAVFDSTGYGAEGRAYARPGRATVAFRRAGVDADWLAQHTHMSLFPGVPTRSFKGKPEKAAR
ncbi:MAG TPA: nuclear transport factor 2 family protein [Candidatus Sulfotelmatobacter sp.]|nr:nuclear transport factor 2 family protein [Candidatus Sulfotelmatobacter sp.]